MNHWSYVIAAYLVTSVGTIGVVVASLVSMRRAEKKVDDL
ncbi:MAG: heme exporter protein CcmD [Sphingomonadaceae bacterium]